VVIVGLRWTRYAARKWPLIVSVSQASPKIEIDEQKPAANSLQTEQLAEYRRFARPRARRVTRP
jgi:hypothetical protein